MAELNLVPFRVKQKKVKDIRNKQIATGLIILLAIMVVIYAVPKITLLQLQKTDAELTSEIDMKANVKVTNVKYKNQVENYTNYINKSDLVKKDKVLAETKINGIQKYMPKDVSCTTVSYNRATINLTGTSTSYNSICELVANIQMAHLYTSARINNISSSAAGKANTFTFNILVTY